GAQRVPCAAGRVGAGLTARRRGLPSGGPHDGAPNPPGDARTDVRKREEPMNEQPWLKSYPAGVRWDAPIEASPVQDILAQSARRFGPLPALQFMDKRIA